MTNRYLIHVHTRDGRIVNMGWHARSAVHRALADAEKAGVFSGAVLFVAYREGWACSSYVAGVGRRGGASGCTWASAWVPAALNHPSNPEECAHA